MLKRALAICMIFTLISMALFTVSVSAADYTQGVSVSGTTATIWFKSTVSTTWVDVHYSVNSGAVENVRMAYSSANARYEQNVTVATGNVITYSFTYNNGTPAYDTSTFTYTVGGTTAVSTPAFTPAAGTYTTAQNVTITCATSGATIKYTTDGSTPTASSATYTGAISVTSTKTIKAIATKSGMTDSAVATATYTINAVTNLALGKPGYASSGNPALALDGNTATRWESSFSDPQWIYVDLGVATTVSSVKLNWETASGKAFQIQVSTNASTWTTVYTTTTGAGGVQTINFNATTARYVRMYGTVRNTQWGYSLWEYEVYGSTPVPTATPTKTPTPVPTATPTRTPTPVSTPVTTPTAQPSGKVIPGKVEAESYDSMLGVQTEACSEGTLDVGWIDTGDYMNYNLSVSTSGAYTLEFRVASPSATGQIQLKNGAAVLATVAVPNTGSWQTWKTVTVPVGVNLTAGNQTLTVYAAAGGFNFNWMNFTSGAPLPPVAAPVFTPVAGTYATAQNVTITCATAGATIKYTLDGTTPTANSATYTGPISIATTTAVKAIAIKSGMANSEVVNATYRISSGNGVMDFQIKNNTNGAYADNQIYWAVLGLNSAGKLCYLDANGNLVPTTTALNDAPGHLTKNGQNYANIYHTIAQKPMVSTPAISSGRMFLSMGSPCYIKVYDDGYAGPDVNNVTDPNNDVYWDFIEFTLDAGGYHGNTTRVDAFCFPITHRLICKDGYDRIVGETESRAALFAAYQNEVPAEFKTLVQAPYRILAPCKGGFKAGGPYGNYFDSYVNQVWHESIPKPTTQDILLGIGSASDPAICAALNRGVYMDPAHWADPNYFYKMTPSNYYSKFWHDHSIDGLSYGFCYDDVNNFAAYLEHNDPVTLVVGVGW